MAEKVRLAVVGGMRGGAFDGAIAALSDRVVLEAVCDIDEKVIAQWKERHPGIGLYTDYDKMLAESDCTAVFVATPYPLHAGQAVKAMLSGRHVISEVVAADSIEDCWKLVETVERTGVVYMLAENCCYMRPNMMVLNMAEKGLFGELTYAEGAYIHDCRDLYFRKDGSPTWRGKLRKESRANTYPTHSLGPVAQWLGINRTDRLVTTASFETSEISVTRYVKRNLGPDHPASKTGYLRHGDSTTTVITTERGAVIVLRIDGVSLRPHNMTHYVLQGSRGAYISPRQGKENHLVWIEGKSEATEDGIAGSWDDLEKYAAEFDHPLWRKFGDEAGKAGHGGGDFFVIYDFVEALLEGKPSPIDVYDAAAWSSIVPLSVQSVENGCVPVEIPDFRSTRNRQGQA